MKVVDFQAATAEEALKSIDSLRAEIASGEIVSFCAVGIRKDDGTKMWLGNVARAKTHLQMLGAMTNLLLCYWQDDIK